MEIIYLDLIYGILGVLLFRFKNPDKQFQNLISVFFLGLFASQLIYFHVNSVSSLITWLISSIGLFTFFLLRLQRNGPLGVADFFKLVAVILVITYPISFYSVLHSILLSEIRKIPEEIRPLTLFVAGTIFVYSRWILKPGFLKRKYVISIIAAQTVLILLLAMYAFVQKAEAEKQRMVAEENAKRAEEAKKKSEEARRRYEENFADSLKNKKAD